MSGFIALNRQLMNHWLYKEKPFCALAAWVDLLLQASYKDTKIKIGRKFITLKRGELFTSLNSLAEAWGWSRTKVDDFLKILEADEMIKQIKKHEGRHIIINNYSSFQDIKKHHERQPKNMVKKTEIHDNSENQLIEDNSDPLNNLTNKQVEELNNINNNNINKLNEYLYELLIKKDIYPPENYLIAWEKNASEILKNYSLEELKVALDWCFDGNPYRPDIIISYKGSMYPDYIKLMNKYKLNIKKGVNENELLQTKFKKGRGNQYNYEKLFDD